ncbi:hypothetical protein [Streptomyces adustus]|uniref:hypothetical protein n=1 Tax=Streptomyces adustus TaxID=1609272 RepID=UPI00371F3E60
MTRTMRLSAQELTEELHDAILDLSTMRRDGTQLSLRGSRTGYQRAGGGVLRWLFPVRGDVAFRLEFRGVAEFSLLDEAQVGTLPLSHVTRDATAGITTLVGNIPVSLSVRTDESGASLTIGD